jgi:pilus assembly protein CpaE
MAILIEADATAVDAFNSALAGAEDVMVISSEHELAGALSSRPEETLVVFGPDCDAHAAFDLASAQRVRRPALGVILVRRRVDSTLLAQAMRAGVREVVRAGSADALADACRRSQLVTSQVATHVQHTTSAKREEPGRVVTVFSAKGGCGKTTIATNIAASLATDGRRVCLVDLDLPFGDVAIMLQLHLERTIADAVAMTGHIDELGVSSIVSTHSSGLDVLVAPLEPAEAEQITPALVTDLLTQLKSMYEVVVVDTPPAFTEPVLAALDMTDLYLLVATLDIPAVKNLKLTLEMLEMLNHSTQNQRIIVNRSDAKVGLKVADVEDALHRSIAVEIPSSRDVPAAVNKGVPLVLDQPNHPVSVALRALATGSITPERPVAPVVEKGATARRVPFLRRGSVPA